MVDIMPSVCYSKHIKQQEADMAIMTETYAQAEAEAIDNHTCFCMCGCRAPGIAPASIFGTPVPGDCDDCRRGKKGHERIATAGMYFAATNPMEAPPESVSRIRRIVARFISPEKRAEAADYAKRMGPTSGPTIAALGDKVEQGKDLTERQALLVLRSKAAEERVAQSALRRVTDEHKRRGAAVDLLRVYIPLEVHSGRYAIQGERGDAVLLEVSRPDKGTLRGFVVIKSVLGEGVRRYGLQYPQPYNFDPETQASPNGYRQTYIGHFPQLVAALVADPDGARSLYNQLMEA